VENAHFRDLIAYRLSISIAREMSAAVESWPNFHLWTVGIQLVRAADSVGANIAEAMGRWHRADQRRLLLVARGSLFETEHWIGLAQERGLLPTDAGAHLPELSRVLNGLIRKRDPSPEA
jgi:four helix bundle protein